MTTTTVVILLGVGIAAATLVAFSWYASWAGDRAAARYLARLERQQAERRIQQITQAAVQQMLDAARHGR